jgi:hypothetical protein
MQKIIFLVEEGQQLHLFFWACLSAKENSSVRHSRV